MSNLTSFVWNEQTHRHDRRLPINAPRRCLTVAEFIAKVNEMIEHVPAIAELPMHLLDLSPEDESPWGGLVTDVEVDCFDDEQGSVLSVMSWPDRPDSDKPVARCE